MNQFGRVALISIVASSAILAGACSSAPKPAPGPTPAQQDSAKKAQDAIDAANRAARQKAVDDSIAAAKARADAAAAAAAKQRADSAAAADRRKADEARIKADAEAKAKADADAARAMLTAVVHFDYDKAELKDDAKAALDAKIPVLNANPAVTLRIAGNTDDRGSGEYNLALGKRRAAAAMKYLTDRGVAANRIETISYGLERKICEEKNEGCWSQNRRDEFEITAGGNALKKP